MNVFVFGDSIGKGIVLNPASGRYEIFDLIKSLKTHRNINLKNYSMFGCTITKGLSLIERHEKKLLKNNPVILEFGGNDCNFIWEEVASAPEKDHKPKTMLENFINTYQAAVERIQKTGAKPILLTLPPVNAERFFNHIVQGVSAENILKFLGGVDMIYRWQEMYSLAVVKLAKKLGVPLIDVRSEFLCRQDLPELLCADGMHPTYKGYELIAKTVYEFF